MRLNEHTEGRPVLTGSLLCEKLKMNKLMLKFYIKDSINDNNAMYTSTIVFLMLVTTRNETMQNCK